MLKFRLAVLLCSVWAALGLTCCHCPAAVDSEYVRIRFPPHETPDVYLQFQGKWLVIADSAKGLEKAQPIRALPSMAKPPQGMAEQYLFPEVELPVSLDGVARVTAAFGISRYVSSRSGRPAGPQAGIDEPNFWAARVYIHRRDSAGATWSYLVLTGGDITTSSDPESGTALPMPNMGDLTFSLATVPSPGKLRIGLRLMSGRYPLNDVRRNDDPRLASVEVTDESGKTIVSETGDLEKFGFT